MKTAIKGILHVNYDTNNLKSKEFMDNFLLETGSNGSISQHYYKQSISKVKKSSFIHFIHSFIIYHSARHCAREWKYKSKHKRHSPRRAVMLHNSTNSHLSPCARHFGSQEVHSLHGHTWWPRVLVLLVCSLVMDLRCSHQLNTHQVDRATPHCRLHLDAPYHQELTQSSLLACEAEGSWPCTQSCPLNRRKYGSLRK